ncbi:hypothetical protein JQ582_23390 [Bradyrhizobium japonicum]|uniref:hypothetical protein n=1 Tax=Bradyrhizobium japonicum TaxID=375 RepID=UPI001BA7D042|nr:hypothetical protein [Bradyrhizobium japonicum]MBR0746879.1 hypothetical protein [Bradyrhizobium japonicum]
MKVRELVETLQRLPDQDATVVIGEGLSPNVWLIVEGAIVRGIQTRKDNLDWVGPGSEPGVEIV